ncbi:hypothetical protein ILUMI_13129 [Ignelater luminosus]|uniref:Uncharacterized protein n=1 Tax=Ignelater luminosus TaxID=2038154 RepID=A0A8K0CWU1_IGNLU|nr:hypothetical protein ILUMI_13129 [Ignelater luminosus]
MNSLVVFFAVLACAFAQYRPQPNYQPSPGKVIAILRQASEVNPDGSYQWNYETENGIAAEEQGHLQQSAASKEAGTAAQGSYHYTAPDGTPVAVQYVADENGFQPQSNVLPVPPPIPPQIARALEWIAAHPQREEQPYKPGRF